MGYANAQGPRQLVFFPVTPSSQNPSLLQAGLSLTKHIYIDIVQTEILTLTQEPGPPRKDFQAHLLLRVLGNLGVLPGGENLMEGIEGFRPSELSIQSTELTWRGSGIQVVRLELMEYEKMQGTCITAPFSTSVLISSQGWEEKRKIMSLVQGHREIFYRVVHRKACNIRGSI